MSNNTTTIDPYTQSLLPKCEGPPYNAQPAILGIPEIPKDINVAMIGGTDVAHPAMVHCCWPNHVQLLNGCFLWCQIPEPRPDEKDSLGQPKVKFEHADDIFGNFTTCLRSDSGYNTSVNLAIQGNIPNMAGERVRPPRLGSFVAMGLLVAAGLVLV